ncbi:Immunoglobulin E-set [Phytophthora cactorum]|nr:Immunoglobulin E-set [Phytophthora cactorum]
MKTNEPTCHVLLALLTLWLPWIITLIAAQSAAPKLMWCASPLTPAVLESPIDTWVDVPDTSVAVKLQNEAVVMISYDVSVTHITDVQPEGVQVSELNELSFRIAVDGTPYRQSATTVDDREPIVVVASGFLVLEIPRGHHLVKLQWRKRGTHVLKWAVASDILDGFAGGRSLTVSAQHRFIWYKQPITAVSLLSLNKWEAVPGMAVNFRLSEPATIRFFYQLPVRPELVQYSRDTAAYDEIETALEINGLRYRETGSYGIVEGSRKSTVHLQGSIIMDLIPGEYSAVIYWKSLLGSSRPWYSSPNALDGFAMGRVLAAVGEWSMDSMSVYHLEQFKPTSVGDWSDVGDSVLQFMLPKATQVSLSYNLPLSQSETRSLAAGLKTRGIASKLASSYASIFISVNTWNNDPKIIAPTLVSGEEDKTLEIVDISISDTDSEMALDYEVTVTMSVKNGVLSLDPTPGITFASGNGDRNEYLLFSGTLSSVNTFLARVWYRSYLNWYGDDELRIKVVDQGVTGFTAASTDETSVVIRIASVNDPPQLIVPSTQFLLEDQQISIFGVRVHDVDPGFAHSNSTFEMQLFVLSGVISLGSTSGVEFIEGDGEADQLLRFRGDLRAINSALFEIKYRPDKDFNSKQHVERLGIRVRDFNYLDDTITDAFKSILIEVQSSDDPTQVVPLELSTITLRGYAVKLLGETTGNEVVYAQLFAMTPVGEIQLSTPSSAFPAGVTKLPAGDEPFNSMTLKGSVADVTDILQSVKFIRAPSFHGYEIIFIRLSAVPDFSVVEDSTIQMNLHSNSSTELWSIANASPSRGKIEGGTTVSVTGKRFRVWPDEALWCRFGRSSLVQATVISDTLLTCVTPPASADLPKRTFMMVTNGDDFYSNPIPLTGNPFHQSAVRKFKWRDVIVITGANLFSDSQANCVFNGSIVTAASFKSSSSILCLSPAVANLTLEPLIVSVAVVLEATPYEAPENFSIYAPPIVSTVNPHLLQGAVTY